MQLHETNLTWNGRLANHPPLLLIHDPDDPDSPMPPVNAWLRRGRAHSSDDTGLGRLAHYRILRHRPAIRAGLEFIGPPTDGIT